MQYCDDPPRAEYRNFALILDDGVKAVCRTVWESIESNDDRESLLKYLINTNPREILLFEEWDKWLRALLSENTENIEGLDKELDSLGEDGSKFTAHEMGIIESRKDDSLDKIANWLQMRLLKNPWDFYEQVNYAIWQSEVMDSDYYQPRVWLEASRAIKLYFPHVINNKKWIGFKTLCLRYKTSAEVNAQVNEILYTFEALEKFHCEKKMIVLTESPTSENVSIMKELAKRIGVIDITQKGVEERLQSMLYED